MMFTGIVQEIGKVRSVAGRKEGKSFLFEAPRITAGLEQGESVAVNGVCLTVTEIRGQSFAADAVGETLRRSTLVGFEKGIRVNLERALRAGERFGGHFVQGHVDCTGVVAALRSDSDEWMVRIRFPREFAGLAVPKGSIALDGISLTVADMPSQSECTIAIIPYTVRETIVQHYRPGIPVNLEFDILGKYVLGALKLAGGEGRLTGDVLREWGY